MMVIFSFDNDEQEEVMLLNRKPPISPVESHLRDDHQYLKELSRGKSCPRCGYINPPSLLSCLECHAVLK